MNEKQYITDLWKFLCQRYTDYIIELGNSNGKDYVQVYRALNEPILRACILTLEDGRHFLKVENSTGGAIFHLIEENG